jgi:hypothetical protein
MERFGGVHGGKFGKRRQYQFQLVEPTCMAFGTDLNLAPCIIRRESKQNRSLSSSHHLSRSPTIWRGGKVPQQEFLQPHHHHLTSINSKIDHRNDGNFLTAQELLDALPVKISCGLLTP